jgi:hypothetical protein
VGEQEWEMEQVYNPECLMWGQGEMKGSISRCGVAGTKIKREMMG